MNRIIGPALAIFCTAAIASSSAAQDAYEAKLMRETADSVSSFEGGGIARIVLFRSAAYYELALVGVTGVDSVTIQLFESRADRGAVTLYDGPRDDVRNLLVTAGMFRDIDVRGASWQKFTAVVCAGETWVHVYTREHPDGDLTGRLVRVPSGGDVLASRRISRERP